MSSTKMRRAILRLTLVLGSAALTLAAFEIAFRIFDVRVHQAPQRQVDVLDPGGRFNTVGIWGTARLKRPSSVPGGGMGEYVPNRTFRFVYYDDVGDIGNVSRAARTAVATINRHGLRGGEIPSGETRRILFLGDSFTFGEGVDDDRPFPSLIQQRFDASPDSRQRYHVINAGVSGYNTRDEVLHLEHRWLDLDPRLVILVFYLNDAYDDGRFADLIMGGGQGRLEPAPESPSRLLEFVSTHVSRWRSGRQITEIYRAQFTDNPAIDGHDWEDSREALRRAVELTTERGIPFAVVIFPELHDLDDSHPFTAIYSRIESQVESLGVPVLNLFPVFKGRAADELWVHVTDHHPNEQAHRIAADAIWGFMHSPDNALLID